MLKVVNTIQHLLIHSDLLCSVSPFLVVGLTLSANIKDIKVTPMICFFITSQRASVSTILNFFESIKAWGIFINVVD